MKKHEVEHICSQIRKKWDKAPPFREPDLSMELIYIIVFHGILDELRIDYYSNVLPVMRMLLESQRAKVTAQILQTLDEDSPSKWVIRTLMDQRRLIKRLHWRPYFGLKDKKKGAMLMLMREDYNHWVLAETMWSGFVRSLQPDFVVPVPLPGHTNETLAVMTDPTHKPLWGMWMAYNEFGREAPTNPTSNNAINVYPMRSLRRYYKQMKLSR
jgi:hypothetical protein